MLKSFVEASDGLTSELIPAGIAFAFIGLLITVGMTVIKSLASGSINAQLLPLFGSFVIMSCVAGYKSVIHTPLKAASNGIATALPEQPSIADALDFSEAYAKQKREAIKKKKKEREEARGDQNKLMKYWNKLRDGVSDFAEFNLDINWSSILANWFSTGLTLGIRTCIEFLSVILLSVLLSFGPVALGLSNIPGFGGLRQEYLAMVAGISAWSLTMRGLDSILNQVSGQMKKHVLSGAATGEDNMEFILIELTICVCYIMVPWISSKYTRSHSGAFLSKAAGATALAARSAAPAAVGAAGRAANTALQAPGAAMGLATKAAAGAVGAAIGVAGGLRAAVTATRTSGSLKSGMRFGLTAGRKIAQNGYQNAISSRAGRYAMNAAYKTQQAGASIGNPVQNFAKKTGNNIRTAVDQAERHMG